MRDKIFRIVFTFLLWSIKIPKLAIEISTILMGLREKETELDVIFPDAYIRAMKPKNWNQVITKNGEYQIITPEKLSLLVGYDRDLPWLVKAVTIAENGGGDYLILAIKKENLCELGNEIYEVLHEMGTVQKIGTLG